MIRGASTVGIYTVRPHSSDRYRSSHPQLVPITIGDCFLFPIGITPDSCVLLPANLSDMNFSSTLGALRLFGFLEGCSFLLFFVTVPLKHALDIKWPNMVVGMAHGLLFISYVLLVYLVAKEKGWSFKTQCWAYLASLLPFGTFVADAKIFKPAVTA